MFVKHRCEDGSVQAAKLLNDIDRPARRQSRESLVSIRLKQPDPQRMSDKAYLQPFPRHGSPPERRPPGFCTGPAAASLLLLHFGPKCSVGF